MDYGLAVRVIVSVLTYFNIGVAAFSEDVLYIIVSLVVGGLAWAYGFWKSNNFTSAAKEAYEVFKELKLINKLEKIIDTTEEEEEVK